MVSLNLVICRLIISTLQCRCGGLKSGDNELRSSIPLSKTHPFTICKNLHATYFEYRILVIDISSLLLHLKSKKFQRKYPLFIPRWLGFGITKYMSSKFIFTPPSCSHLRELFFITEYFLSSLSACNRAHYNRTRITLYLFIWWCRWLLMLI